MCISDMKNTPCLLGSNEPTRNLTHAVLGTVGDGSMSIVSIVTAKRYCRCVVHWWSMWSMLSMFTSTSNISSDTPMVSWRPVKCTSVHKYSARAYLLYLWRMEISDKIYHTISAKFSATNIDKLRNKYIEGFPGSFSAFSSSDTCFRPEPEFVNLVGYAWIFLYVIISWCIDSNST